MTSPDAEGSGETAQRFAAMLRRLRLRTGRGWEGEGRLTRRPRSHAVRTVSVAAVLACLVPLACSTPGIADRAPGGPPHPVSTAALAAQTAPAVRLVIIDEAAPLSVPSPLDNIPAQQGLAQAINAGAASGRIPGDLQSKVAAYLKAEADSPDAYFTPGPPLRQVQGKVEATCTGWLVTPDGYLVTAAHCTVQDGQQLTTLLAQQALPPIDKQDAQSWLNQLGSFGNVPVTDDDVQQLVRIASTFNQEHLTIGQVQQTVRVVMPAAGGGTPQPVTAFVVGAGTPYPGQDYSLLKVDGFSDLPSLALGDDSGLQIGDTVYIDGFPGTVMTSPFTNASQLDPTFTSGPINAYRTSTDNVPYLQTQAPAYHGNSGGPVLDSAGRVIGTLIAGAVDNSGQVNVEGYEFVLPVRIVRNGLREHNVTPRIGATTRIYNQAVDDYYRHFYRRALDGFDRVHQLAPDYPGVATFIGDAHRAIAAGEDRTPRSGGGPPWPAVIAAVAGAGLLVEAVAIVLLRRRRIAVRSEGTPAPP